MPIRPSAPSHVFIGRRPCGCITAVVNDEGDKFTRRTVYDYATSGLTVARISWEAYRQQVSREATFMKCPHDATAATAHPPIEHCLGHELRSDHFANVPLATVCYWSHEDDVVLGEVANRLVAGVPLKLLKAMDDDGDEFALVLPISDAPHRLYLEPQAVVMVGELTESAAS